ncbi:hypothetical protein NEOLEDRAFT_1127839 [Neolentinus lepideus HHB14362 ss-1]|uniref:Uncharacterized protein n=1 Tax=Neolentinus lepideus HHB14362 ss-1 TaxID=1314782 RepID=A0A165VNE3_9AGAM|nr:hypothetical protein NEOLEDRAFT_1127839 [Neolentinus lepideus HHB14362 ss-1]
MANADLRALMFFHHILNKTKKRALCQLAIERSIRGYVKYGYPGVLVCQGEDAEIKGYIREVKNMRWQQVRLDAMDRVPQDPPAHIPMALKGLEEVASISDIVKTLGVLGSDWETWFKQGMGYSPR